MSLGSIIRSIIVNGVVMPVTDIYLSFTDEKKDPYAVSGVYCGIDGSSQGLDSKLYNHICGQSDGKGTKTDNKAVGELVKKAREHSADYLHKKLGTTYSEKSNIVVDCERAMGGFCVMTPTENGDYVLDIFSMNEFLPDNKSRIKLERFYVKSECFNIEDYKPFSPEENWKADERAERDNCQFAFDNDKKHNDYGIPQISYQSQVSEDDPSQVSVYEINENIYNPRSKLYSYMGLISYLGETADKLLAQWLQS